MSFASVRTRFAASVAAALCQVACGGASLPASVGQTTEPPPSADSAPRPKPRTVPEDVVARAAGPVRALRLEDGEEVSGRALAAEWLAADAVCLGEDHASAAHHFAELWTLDLLADPARMRGLELGVGFEMFQKHFQGHLSAFQRGRLDAAELRARSEYDERWGYPLAFYRPILERARFYRLPLLALNARRELTRAVAREGLAKLSRPLLWELPALDLDDQEHREDFDRRMRHHPGMKPGDLANYYAAQVTWDETMAEVSASWLAEHAPVRRLIIIAGAAHCQRSAIPERLERRGVRRAVSVRLATARPSAEDAKRFDFALVVGTPDSAAR